MISGVAPTRPTRTVVLLLEHSESVARLCAAIHLPWEVLRIDASMQTKQAGGQLGLSLSLSAPRSSQRAGPGLERRAWSCLTVHGGPQHEATHHHSLLAFNTPPPLSRGPGSVVSAPSPCNAQLHLPLLPPLPCPLDCCHHSI